MSDMGAPADDAVAALVARGLRDGASLRRVLLDTEGAAVSTAARVVVDAVAGGGTLFVFGNGGSAADAQHIASELVGRYERDRPGLRAIALTVDTSALTAIANDFGFDQVFARQLTALGRPGDVALALSTSGASPNVLEGVAAARALGITVVGLTGAGGGELAARCDHAVVVPSTETARIQEVHLTIGHLLCEAVDAAVTAAGRDGEDRAAARSPRPAGAPAAVLARPELLAERARLGRLGRTVVWTNGVFDVLHVGHVTFLQAARRLGDVLIVGVNADSTVRASKGPDRPVFPVEDRVAVLSALEAVDVVHVFEEATPVEVLSELRPDVHCKGADYAPPHGAAVPEADVVRSYGGRVEFLPLVPGRSTTAALARLGVEGS
ncbi:MAG: SIS domain-containing protein [Microthrixaceae bacterium]|nr:SIS domain-containing protein [Microthrixaceae bacterium]